MIHIGIEERMRKEVAYVLNTLLADEYVLSTKTKNCHWNVVGLHFHDLHALFGDQYHKLDLLIDELAERVRAVGGNAIGTMTEFLKFARLDERPGIYPSESAMVEDLLDAHETIIRTLRELLQQRADNPCDVGTTDFLTKLLQEHEKVAWMLRSFLGDPKLKWLKDQEAVQFERPMQEAGAYHG
jgi:starvation-inducible DNA-binding protein